MENNRIDLRDEKNLLKSLQQLSTKEIIALAEEVEEIDDKDITTIYIDVLSQRIEKCLDPEQLEKLI